MARAGVGRRPGAAGAGTAGAGAARAAGDRRRNSVADLVSGRTAGAAAGGAWPDLATWTWWLPKRLTVVAEEATSGFGAAGVDREDRSGGSGAAGVPLATGGSQIWWPAGV
ncbi:hypothetical protein Syun_022002 [Stephania yunnanensis]|uniref:Uncharacterized protein n=1 Tax=Stephania yunnanensis TaxID=152371 RepID=A0AAP0IH45_9MAGN